MRLAALLICFIVTASVATAASLAEGDPQRGAVIYERCLACHALTYHRTGPKHCGLLGRRAGSIDGFDFSPALRALDIVWTSETLDRFLSDPLAMVPESTMGYDGIEDTGERADLIAYLASASEDSALCR